MEAPDVDKRTWGPGPWQDEPDRLEWRHAGLACLITRVPESGHLCGYVAVPPGHPVHGKDYYDGDGDGDLVDISAPGGLTYADKCQGVVCHVPAPGEPDDVWWLGFDCAHYGDFCPAASSKFGWHEAGATYKTIEFVKAAVNLLAEQLQAKEAPGIA